MLPAFQGNPKLSSVLVNRVNENHQCTFKKPVISNKTNNYATTVPIENKDDVLIVINNLVLHGDYRLLPASRHGITKIPVYIVF